MPMPALRKRLPVAEKWARGIRSRRLRTCRRSERLDGRGGQLALPHVTREQRVDEGVDGITSLRGHEAAEARRLHAELKACGFDVAGPAEQRRGKSSERHGRQLTARVPRAVPW